MTSTITGQNKSAKASKVPIPISNTNASSVREDTSTSQAKKPPFETRKSAEELKLRLASAVSAKIALSKDGRNSSNNIANRGIGFLLQRKEQQENRLNTKDISFQKSARNGGEKPVEMMAKNTNSSVKGARGGMSKAELQKSLLSALMNSRAPSGGSLGQNRSKDTRVGTTSKLNSENKGKTIANEFNKAPLSTPKTTNENVAKKSRLDNGVLSGQTNDTNLGIGSKMNRSGTKTNTSGFNKTPLSTLNPKSENIRSKSPLESSNSSGGILDRAKNIERLLGQRRRENIPVESTIATKDVALNGKDKNAEQNKRITNVNGENSEDFNRDKTATVAKSVDERISNLDANLNKTVEKTKLPVSPRKDGDVVLRGRIRGDLKTPKTNQPAQNTRNERIASTNGENNGKFDANNKIVSTRKPPENFGKKLPPPVAKKPSKEDLQKSKQASLPLGINKQESIPLANGNMSSNGKVSRQNEPPIITTKRSSPQIQRKAGALKVDGLNSKNETAALLSNGSNSGNDGAFREDLLDKLEADVGSCKIAAFQSMEDFSVLRMKVYRMRGELDQLKRDREKRTPLVC